MNKYILDSSALLALIQQEPGAEVIRSLLQFSVMSAVNVAEVLTALQRTGIEVGEAKTLIYDIIPEIISFDLEQASLVAELRQSTQHLGLSLGDRACIALGIKLQSSVYTADRTWSKLDLHCQINQIR